MKSATSQKSSRTFYFGALLLFLGLLCLLFLNSFTPYEILFSNDGPLGAVKAADCALPGGIRGVWQDLNYLGSYVGGISVDITATLLWALGPLYFAKFYVPLVISFVGISAWFFFRSAGFASWACVLGGFAAAFNSTYFSVACWGVGPQALAAGFSFIALGFVANPAARGKWVRYILAGFAVGLGVAEGADVGAIFSMFVALVLFFQTWITQEGSAFKKVAVGVGRVGLIAVCAAFIAAHTVSSLVGTSIQGVAGVEQSPEIKRAKWDWATQWSWRKRETLTLFVPGIFGFRMTPPPLDGSDYWGPSGRDLAWDRYFEEGKQGPPPQAGLRFSGGGAYAGVLVVFMGFWAVFQSFRKHNPVYSPLERKFVWFWTAVALGSLLLAYGRFAPFYQFVYALPYASTIRNPCKFLHTLTVAILVLFGYGIHGLVRGYMEKTSAGIRAGVPRFKTWWQRAPLFDRRWMVGCAVALGAGVLGWLIYWASRAKLESYLMEVPLQNVPFDEAFARKIADFSIMHVGLFVLFLFCSMSAIALIMSGYFTGKRVNWGGALLSIILLVDLSLADRHWIYYWNWQQKYASNPVIDLLRQQPYEHRVAIFPFPFPPDAALLKELYRIEWAQHHFLYYNIQSLDIIQESRMPNDKLAFEAALAPTAADLIYRLPRKWQLTNTRYFFGPADFLPSLNQELDPVEKRFKILTRFKITPKPGIQTPTKLEELTAEMAPDGPFALYEFVGALPRAKLYSTWHTSTNSPEALQQWSGSVRSHVPAEMSDFLPQLSATDQATLMELGDRAFDPATTVLVASPLPHPNQGTNSNGRVEFASYAPKDLTLKSDSPSPSVLLLNDKYDPRWQVWVDGKRAELLRCNFIMQGVYLPAGAHQIHFVFRTPVRMLYVTMAAIGIGILLLGCLIVIETRPGGREKYPEGKDNSGSNPARSPADNPAKSKAV